MLSTKRPDAPPARPSTADFPQRRHVTNAVRLVVGLGTLFAAAVGSSSCEPTSAAIDGGIRGDGACREGSVEVGASSGRFIPLPRSGGELQLVLGAQGGIHVLVGFRPHAVPLTLSATYRLVDATTHEVLGEPTQRALGPGLYRVDADGPARVDDLIVLDPNDPRIAEFTGRAASLELDVVTETGGCAHDARLVTLR